MLKEKLIETLTREWAKRSDQVEGVAEASESQFKQFLQNRLKDLEVLTRDEFKQYADALERAEQRITALEQKLQDQDKPLDKN